MKKRILSILLVIVMMVASLLPVTALAAETEDGSVTVGNGTDKDSYIPTYSFNNYSKSQTIVPASELTALNGKSIIGMSYYPTNQSKMRKVAIYLMETNQNDLNTSFVNASGATAVYSGDVLFTADTETHIDFSTPYVYSGGNLLVTALDLTGTWSSGLQFYGVKDNSDADCFSRYAYRDSGPFDLDPTNDLVTGTNRKFRPKMAFHIGYTVTNGTPESAKETNHGYIAIDKTSAAEDDTVTLTVAPSAGYQLKAGTLKVTYTDGTEKTCQLTQDSTNTTKFTFTMPGYPVTVTAEFEVIGGTGSGEWFGYCTEDIEYKDTIGANGLPFTFAIKIPVASLPNQDVLSKVSFHTNESGTYHVRIYSTDPSAADPGTAAPDYEQEFTVSNPKQWEDIVLITPYEVDKTKNLWIGIEATDHAYPATHSTDILETTDCCMIYLQGSWAPINELGSFEIRPWMIRGYFETVTPVSGGKTLPYSFDFETDFIDAGWTNIDADHDGQDWITGTNKYGAEGWGVEGSRCAISQSYDNDIMGSFDADNWLFSPAITIPEGGATVSWYEQSQDANYPDSYTVYVSETNTITDTSKMTEIFSGTAAKPWNQRSVELEAAEYAGKTVYIAFRHRCYDCYMLDIDDFAVAAVAHVHTEADAVEENLVEADCTNKGSYDKVVYCEVCGAELSRENFTIDALGHDLTHHEAKAPTCTEIGWEAYDTCSRCDYTTYKELAVLGHTHAFTYTANNGKITATCVDGCDKGYDTTPLTLTLTAPASLVYDGNAKAFTFADGEAAAWTGAGLELPTFEYYLDKPETPWLDGLDGDPIAAAEGYVVMIRVGVKAAQVEFNIDKATPYIKTTPAPNDIEYGKKLSDSTLVGGYVQVSSTNTTQVGGSFEWKLGDTIPALSDSETTEYDVTFTPADTNNYNTVSCKVKIKITHIHNLIKVTGQAATETAAGFKDYYKCDCDLYFEDEDCTVEIGGESALVAWKTGKGAIAKLVHTVTPVSGKTATQTEPGFKAYYECKNCGKYYEDAAGKAVITNLSAWKAKDGNGYIPSGDEIEAAKTSAKAELDTENAKDALLDKTALTNGKSDIDNAETLDDIENAKTNAISAIQQAQATELAGAKTSAKSALDTEEAKDPLTDKTPLTTGKSNIDNAGTKAAVATAKSAAVTAIQQAQAGELATAKTNAKAELDTEEAKDPLTDKTSLTTGKSNIDNAGSKAAVATAKSAAVTAIQQAQAGELATAKTNAKAELDTEEAKDPLTDKTPLTTGKSNIENAETKAAVATAKSVALDAIKNDQQGELDKAIKDAQKALSDENAKDPLIDNSIFDNEYAKLGGAKSKAELKLLLDEALVIVGTKQQIELDGAKENAKKALDNENAKDLLSDATTVNNGKNAIDAAKTKAEVEKVKNDAVTAIKAAQKASDDPVDITIEDGDVTDVVLKVKVVVKADVVVAEDHTAIVDYKELAEKKEVVASVYDVRLLLNGVEIQPDELGSETIVTVRMLIPEDLTGKEFRLVHVHAAGDRQTIVQGEEAGVGTYVIDENGYLVTKLDRFSEFVFLRQDTSVSLWWLWLLIALIVIGGAGTTYYFVRKKKKNQ